MCFFRTSRLSVTRNLLKYNVHYSLVSLQKIKVYSRDPQEDNAVNSGKEETEKKGLA